MISLLTACSAGTSEPSVGGLPPAVRLAASSAVISGQSVSINAYLWRDFMPSTSAPNDTRLIASVTVRDGNGGPLSSGITGDSLWVLAHNDVWATAIQDQSRTTTSLQLVARDGPLWEPGTHVDGVARLSDQSGHTAYVRVADLVITRTD